MSLIRKHGAVLQAWACLDLVFEYNRKWVFICRDASAAGCNWKQQRNHTTRCNYFSGFLFITAVSYNSAISNVPALTFWGHATSPVTRNMWFSIGGLLNATIHQ